MPYQTTHCDICGTDPYKPSKKHSEVCPKCESQVHNCILSNTKITDNGQPYSFITSQTQLDEISKQLGNSRDYEFKPSSYVNCIDGLPDEIKDTWDELDIKMYNEKLPEALRTKARKDIEIFEQKYFKPLIGFIELWLCSSCERRLENKNREFAMPEVLAFLKNSDPESTHMVNELVSYFNGDIDSSNLI